MGLEVLMRQEVGDGKVAQDAVAEIVANASNWSSALSLNVTIPNDTDTPDSYTKDDFADPSGDNELLAQEVVTFLNGLGLSATRSLDIVSIVATGKGRVGNEIGLTTNTANALAVTGFTDGRDENEAVDMTLTLEDDDELVMVVDGEVIFRTPFIADSFENSEPFERNLTRWLKKTRC